MSQLAWENRTIQGSWFDKHQMVFETLDSKIAKGTTKVFGMYFYFLEETLYQKHMSHTKSQAKIMCQIFSFSNNKSQGHTLNLNDVLNVDNLKMFNRARETLLIFASDSDESVLDILFDSKCESSHS